MKTLDRMRNDCGIKRISKLVDDDFFYFNRIHNENDYNRVIIKHINDCCIAISNEGKDSADAKLYELAETLRNHFNSDYCAIGRVDGQFVEDCIVSLNPNFRNKKNALKRVKRIRIDNPNCCVCKGLKSDESIVFFNENEIKASVNYYVYKDVLGEVKYTTIIPIRDRDEVNKGYVQFINSRKKMVFNNIKPFYDSLLRLILILNQREELEDAQLFKKDFDFLSLLQKKIDDVDILLYNIMEYLSNEFNAGVVSYRIPLLVGTEKKPLFFLRDCYIKKNIAKYYSEDDYIKDRLIKQDNEMGGYENLAGKEIDSVFIDRAKDSTYYEKITDKSICFRDGTLIIPILRDYSEKDENNYSQQNEGVSHNEKVLASFRFAKYFGVFKLRILRNADIEDEKASEWLSEETKKRLSNLAKQISVLLNTIVEKHENNSLDILQKELKGTSFTKIKEFDEQCARIVKKAIRTRNCIIYRYKNGNLSYSASAEPIDDDFNDIIEEYGEKGDVLVKKLFEQKEPVYFVRSGSDGYGSIMLVPIIGKDNSERGVMLLVGKEYGILWNNLSKTFWEHDKKHIEFIFDILIRIEESDSERLAFLSQLSHELLRPVTAMVNRNEYCISMAMRGFNVNPRKILIQEIRKNLDMCMMFKNIIDDTQYIYSLSKGDVQYYFEMVDFKDIIVDAVKMFEEEAYVSKRLSIKTDLGNMPEKLYIDRSRMRQVVINLLKNAIQYSLPDEEISIRYEFYEKEGYHEISFSDMGIPINPIEKDAIFDMFFRSKQAVDKRPSGTGIGLYLVKQIMKAHGGDCYVKELGSPTTFTIQIPNKK